ncbi:SIS domain-containing protein [Roseinatronobacter sp. S2]|uniref:SIS domain-containing protein n=1 Tax=Roseinatronobacter sp. S2 TaxID=3035471 RepID=UPI00240F950D|nr:SIS domain-containing protein [Roseinatronobacter sp. S2]WFE75801.1 SIS domain-containing protein [Roseinatronobacter sp. S2]
MDREAKAIAGFAVNSAEFTTRAPRRLGKSSVVVLCSHSGTTPETVLAAQTARAAGALTIALTHVPDSPLDVASEHVIYYDHDPMTMSPQHSAAVVFRLSFGILATREGNATAIEFDRALSEIGVIVAEVTAGHREKAVAFAAAHKREPVIYTMASGTSYGVAYSYAICIFQEMLWIHSAAINSGEYFHGPFEITDFDTPFLILLGLGNSRTMDERAVAFARKFSQRTTILMHRNSG